MYLNPNADASSRARVGGGHIYNGVHKMRQTFTDNALFSRILRHP